MSYQALELDGNGYASIADASQKGLDMGLSDFMIEGWIKTTYSADYQWIVVKETVTIEFHWRMEASGFLRAKIGDGVNNATIIVNNLVINDGRWHNIVFIGDRSEATGLKFFVDGVETTYSLQQSPISVGNLDNASVFALGRSPLSGLRYFTGYLDEFRIWNFGKDGLPADYAAYITWRAAGRNRFLDISNYSGGAWNIYADADRAEVVASNPGFEGGTDGWSPVRCTLVTDSGTVRTGNNSGKMTQNVGASGDYYIRQSIKDTISINEYYELSAWVYVPSTNTAVTSIRVELTSTGTDTTYSQNDTSIEDAWARISAIIKTDDISGYAYINIKSLNGENGDIMYVDDVSIKRIGLVTRYKFSGNYNDETANANHLTAGGSGNTFPGYSLRSKAQKQLLGVW